jgi:hypothetical protein
MENKLFAFRIATAKPAPVNKWQGGNEALSLRCTSYSTWCGYRSKGRCGIASGKCTLSWASTCTRFECDS